MQVLVLQVADEYSCLVGKEPQPGERNEQHEGRQPGDDAR
jgi:hypothetical protein